GALVQAVSLETQISRHATTDARGRYTIVFPDGGGQYDLTIRFIGMAPANVSVARQGDEDRLVANVQMGASAVALEAVTVSARRASSRAATTRLAGCSPAASSPRRRAPARTSRRGRSPIRCATARSPGERPPRRRSGKGTPRIS